MPTLLRVCILLLFKRIVYLETVTKRLERLQSGRRPFGIARERRADQTPIGFGFFYRKNEVSLDTHASVRGAIRESESI